jgi:hypothetical protein
VAGRAAKCWAGVLAVAFAGGVSLIQAADPPPPPSPPPLPVADPADVIPPMPPTVEPPAGPSLPPPVTVFRQPPDAPPLPGEVTPPVPGPTLEPFLPQPATPSEVILPDGSRVNLPPGTRQQIRYAPRYGVLPNWNLQLLDKANNIHRVVYTGGLIINVVYLASEGPPARFQEVELAADNVVAWVKTTSGQQFTGDLSTVGAENEGTEVELYLSGNVVIRTLSTDTVGNRTVEQVFRAAEVYYDVNRHRAIAVGGDLELRVQGVEESIHLRGQEVWQLSRNEWRLFESDAYSSKRPAQPGLRISSRESTLIQRTAVRRNIFGIPYRDLRTGQIDVGQERVLYNDRVRLKVFDTPVFFWPRSRVDIGDPFGPLAGIGFGQDRIFGTQIYTTWDIYQLLALRGPPGHQWVLHADYLSDRGPAAGTDYTYVGRDLFGLAGVDPHTGLATRPAFNQPYTGLIRLYGIHDRKERDILGGDRGPEPEHPDFRGRAHWRHNQDVYEYGTTFLRLITQVGYFSDKNFFEQYYKIEYDMQPNQETFAHLYGAAGNLGGSLLVQGNLQRDWMTETEWWPRGDGYLIGQSLLWDRLIYSARGDIGYAGLRPSEIAPLPVMQTDRRVDTGRFHLNQRLSAPFDLGPVRLDPYGVMDLAYYTDDISRYNAGVTRATAGAPIFAVPGNPGAVLDPAGEGRGRFYGGGGLKASTTLSRLYPDAASEMFNVRGLYHKVTYGANYFAAYSDTPYWQLPQLDRLYDDAADFTYRLARPRQRAVIGGAAGEALATSPLFDPQRYAIRRLVDNRYDTLDTIEVLQVESRHRWQTKRGFPGAEHIVDWITFDTSISYFPDAQRDNFGENWAFWEYFFLWHVGDRMSLSSAGWYDPFEFGPRYFNLGLHFNRPDGTNFYLGYRHTDPIESRALTASVSYKLTRKYSVNFIGTYDFGVNEILSQQVNIARVGTDVTVLFGVSYNALVNNFGVQFALVPNLAGLAALQPGAFAGPFNNPFLGRR